jgi:hypothetical protein
MDTLMTYSHTKFRIVILSNQTVNTYFTYKFSLHLAEKWPYKNIKLFQISDNLQLQCVFY